MGNTTLRNIISYPVKYLLKGRVETYKKELNRIESEQQCIIKNGTSKGLTGAISNLILRNIYLSIKYKKYIKRWDI